MLRTSTLLVLLVALALLATGCGPVSAAREGKPVAVVNLTAGPQQTHRVWMALRLAEHLVESGRAVIVFLNVDAAPLASRKLGEDVGLAGKPPLREMVAMLSKKGVTILVCPECAELTGVAEADLVPGAKMATRESLLGPLDDSAVVFSY
jgi:predicted peroxiredoxin